MLCLLVQIPANVKQRYKITFLTFIIQPSCYIECIRSSVDSVSSLCFVPAIKDAGEGRNKIIKVI